MTEIGAEVVNGTVYPGDKVAYASRDSNRAAIHVGTVTRILSTGKLRIKVEAETPSSWERTRMTRVVSNLDQVLLIEHPVKQIQGPYTIDVEREKLGLKPFGLKETSEPIVMTKEGPVPFSKASQTLERSETFPGFELSAKQVQQIVEKVQAALLKQAKRSRRGSDGKPDD